MMPQADNQRFDIGRSRGCDVVVDDVNVADIHCNLQRDLGRWIATPIDGRLGIRRSDQNAIEWTETAMEVQPTDDLWLEHGARFPWPCEDGAVKILTVGRATDSDVILENASVSGLHAKIIVGPQETLVLKDCSSRNGLFIDADFSERIAATMLRDGQTVYFGSFEVAARKLIDLSLTTDSASRPAAATLVTQTLNPGRKSKSVSARSHSRLKHTALFVAPAFATCLVLFWWSSRAKTVVESPQADQLATAKSPMENTPSLQKVIPEQAAEPKHDLATATPEPTANTETTLDKSATHDTDVRDSLYWILVRHDATETHFRLGCGVAVSPNKILTTASVLQSIDKLLLRGYSEPTVVSVGGETAQPIEQYNVWSHFLDRSERADRVREMHAAKKSATDENPDKDPGEESALAKEINFALSAAAAVDLGWLHVNDLPDHVAVDSPITFRPGQAIDLLDTGFDGKDPYFDYDGTRPISATRTPNVGTRVWAIGPEIDDIAGVIKLQCVAQVDRDHNLIGSILTSHDKLAGIIVFQQFDSTRMIMLAEAVPAQTIQAALQMFSDDSATNKAIEP